MNDILALTCGTIANKISEIGLNGQLKSGVILDTDNERTLFNWITEMDLQGAPAWKTSILGSLFFVGFLISAPILAIFDKYGRKINIYVGAYISIFAFFLLIFVNNLYGRYIMVAILGAMNFKNIQAYSLCSELVGQRHKLHVTTIILGMNGMILPATAFYFKFISKEWKYLYYFYAALVTIFTFALFFVPESPRFLYEKEKYKEARMIVDKMAKFNSNVKLVPGDWLFDKEKEEDVQHEFKLNNSEISASSVISYSPQKQKTIEERRVRGSIHDMKVVDKESPMKIMRAEPIVFI